MAPGRKLQMEIDKTLKKVMEGIEVFDTIWDKVRPPSPGPLPTPPQGSAPLGLHPARPPALPCGAARPPSAGQSRPWALSRPVEAAAGPAPRPAPPPGAPRGVARGQTHPPWEGEGGRAVNHPGRRAGQQGAAGPASSQDNPAAS